MKGAGLCGSKPSANCPRTRSRSRSRTPSRINTRKSPNRGLSALENLFRGRRTGEINVIAQMLGPEGAAPLRAVSKTLKAEVNRSRWDDLEEFGPPIRSSLEAWRKANPRAEALNVRGRIDLKDADFVHVRGIKKLNIAECRQLTDAAFEHFEGLHTLILNGCNQRAITDAAFRHLKGIHTLVMRGCNQDTITDAAFEHLRGIHTLNLNWCHQRTITDAAFEHLKGIHTLEMMGTAPDTVTGAALRHLKGIHTLNLCWVGRQFKDTDFEPLRGIAVLQLFQSPSPKFRPGPDLLRAICSPRLRELWYDAAATPEFVELARRMFGTERYEDGAENHIVERHACSVRGGGARRRTRRLKLH